MFLFEKFQGAHGFVAAGSRGRLGEFSGCESMFADGDCGIRALSGESSCSGVLMRLCCISDSIVVVALVFALTVTNGEASIS